ncbi:MAG: archaellin/type IV pilin N-terminal domain-containing protein [Nanoarchaeota archaeon]|nr:archaellin/type IV pilin N-terminal domain-containing protein [Nanoarchaeota archaeon]
MNKKAVSGVISTVLMILLVITSTGILASVVMEIVKLPILSPETNCLQIQLDNLIKIQTACYNSETQELKVSLQRNSKTFTIKSLDFAIGDETFTCNCDSCDILAKGNFATYYFDKNAEQVSVIINGCLVDSADITDC